MGCMCSKGTMIERREVRRLPPPPSSSEESVAVPRPTPSPSFLGKSYSFHVFEKPDATAEAEGKAVFRTGSMMSVPRIEIEGIRPLRENFFIMRDRMEMERAGKVASFDGCMNGRGLPAAIDRSFLDRESRWGNDGVQGCSARGLRRKALGER